ncbi:MAG: HAD family hydrolase [Candidatus Levyibacteriota bacterium]
MLKAVLLDFDGTLVTKDILDVICGIVGKEEASETINKAFHAGKLPGLTALITRINFLKGVCLSQIAKKLDEEAYLMSGAREIFTYLKQHSILIIIHSGNIIPVLLYYQNLLGADYIVGTQPQMNGDTIASISEENFSGQDFKVIGVKEILKKLAISAEDTLAIGDSPADKIMFAFAGNSIAVNPKDGIEQEANHVIKDSLDAAIQIIENSILAKKTT